jgi:hypothetical protein
VELTEQLVSKTKVLLRYIEEANNRFFIVKESGKKPEFYTEVKPFADEVGNLLNEWVQLAENWVSRYKPKNIHRQQIDSTRENIELVSIQSFYPESSRVRFVNYISSINYVLTTILVESEQK